MGSRVGGVGACRPLNGFGGSAMFFRVVSFEWCCWQSAEFEELFVTLNPKP